MTGIKCRAWDMKNKKMQYMIDAVRLSIFSDGSGSMIDELENKTIQFSPYEYQNEKSFNDKKIMADEGILMLYAEHKIDDEEIYLDDIIEFTYCTGYSNPITKGVVKHGEYLAGHNDYGDIVAVGFYVEQIDICVGQQWNIKDEKISKGKIIGNIWENKELLNE